MMRCRPLHRSLAAILAICCPALASADEIWSVRGGTTTLELNVATLEKYGLTVERADPGKAVMGGAEIIFSVEPDSTLAFVLPEEMPPEFLGGKALHDASLRIRSKDSDAVMENVTVGLVEHDTTGFAFKWGFSGIDGAAGLAMGRYKAAFDRASDTMTMHSPELRITPELAERLGDKSLAGLMIGTLTLHAAVEWVGGSEPEPYLEPEPTLPPPAGGPRALVGCDMAFCQLYGVIQMGRTGDRVGLTVATTSWNLGTEDCIWLNIPDEEHPFIVYGMYRLKTVDGSERFENIGYSAIKHGFYAMGSHQCGGPPCTFEPGHGAGDWLGQGCTDTYSASLNGQQSGMGPKHEVDPWAGYWYYPGSHMEGSHSHPNGWEHRIAVYDDDLNPALNAGATYTCEAYYVMMDDIDVWNSASWKDVTITGGAPGLTWSFGMSGSGTMANVGFAIDSWVGAQQTLIAEEIPVIEFSSPDGRSVLAAKATDLGGGTWHYEYAMLNVDMHRKVGSFSIPVTPGTIVTNIGFHAPDSSEILAADDTIPPIDNPYSNDAWVGVHAGGAVTWTTVDNPIRWSTLYNFRFDANVPPHFENLEATVGLFEPGTPTSLPAMTVVPSQGPPDCDDDGVEDECELDCNAQGGACNVPGCGTSVDCNGNGVPDDCELDCNANGIADECDVPPLGSYDVDCNGNLVPDGCEPDCNSNGIVDECDVPPLGSYDTDCNANLVPDACDPDCNATGIPDECEVPPIGSGEDCNENLVPDECEPGYICDNNLCTNATVIWAGAPGTPATYVGSTIGVQPDGDAACAATSSTGPDMWYKYTPSVNGTLIVETCAGTDFDTYLSLHPACPGNQANQLACSDDDCATSRSRIIYSVTGHQTYLIRVSGNNFDEGNFTLSVTGPASDADPIRGGRMWDNWWMALSIAPPMGDHPLYPPEGQQTGSATFRCKECHGWDFKGAAGAYGSGSHYTGIGGVYGTTLTATEMFKLIRDDDIPNGHGYRNYGLSDAVIWDLVDFITKHVVDTDLYIDANAAFIGSAAVGQSYYNTTTGGLLRCAACHDESSPPHPYKGTAYDFGSGPSPEWVGTLAVDNPWELFHKIRFGQPEVGFMPKWLNGTPPAGTDQGAADIGAFAQTTAFAYDCTNNSYCDDGDPCTGSVVPCLGGRCTVVMNGDINMDGESDGLDIQNFVQAILSASTNPDDLTYCDFSENGVIDEADVPCMVNVLLK